MERVQKVRDSSDRVISIGMIPSGEAVLAALQRAVCGIVAYILL